MLLDKKKKRVSKKSKRAWRKHTDVEDVENFLEDKRADLRLGLDKLSKKKDDELFTVDTVGDSEVGGKPRSKKEKRAWAKQPPKYQLALIPTSAIEDPIQRNRVCTKEERKHPARKLKDAVFQAKGLIRSKDRLALKDRKLSLRNNKKLTKERRLVAFKTDIWQEGESKIEAVMDATWLGKDAKVQVTKDSGEFKVRPPTDLGKKRSNLPVLETPHPGLSYNPSLRDHKELINLVVEKEVKMMKADAHLARVTSSYRVASSRKQFGWVEEMMQGLKDDNESDKKEEISKGGEEGEEVNLEEKDTVLLKKVQPKMKTKKQRRAQKRIRDEALQRKSKAVEKRKTSDMHKLRAIVTDLDEEETRLQAETEEKQKAKQEYLETGTKRLARLRYQEPLEDYSSAHELSGSLRKLTAKSTLLKDRFFSMQKRNLLQPTNRIFKSKKRKVKMFIKRDHRIAEDKPIPKAGRKMKVINTF